MIRCNDHDIVGLEPAQQLGKAGIECLEGRGVAGDVAPMAIDRVEVDEVGEQQTSVWQVIPAFQHAIEQCVIPIAPLVEAGSTMSKNIVNLSNRDDIAALGRGDIQNGRLRRRYRKIAPVRGSPEILAPHTNEGPGDYTTDIEGIDQPAGDRADLVKPLQPKTLLMRGDLEHAIRRAVADRLSGLQVLLAELLDDLGSGGMPVAQNTGKGGLFLELVDQLAGKAGLRLRKVAPVEPNRHSGDLPVA